MLRVLIVDDSPTLRLLIRRILGSDPGIQVVGEAANGEEAIALCRKLNPDIITMDIHMPGMDGYEAVRHIMAEMPRPIVVLTSTESDIRLGITYKAIECGALMVLGKPKGLPGTDPAEADRLISQIKSMADVKVVRRTRWPQPEQPKMPGKAAVPRNLRLQPVRLVAIGVSTGGPPALQAILSRLPAGFPAPILVVQHMSRNFISGLAIWLNETTPLQVMVPQTGEKLKPGMVYLAPDDRHLTVSADGYVWLKKQPLVDGHCPSATVLFESAAAVNGPETAGVILTGMGSDGARGLKTLRDAGGYTIAQDEASCIIFGMPKEAIAMGAVNEVLPLEMISGRLIELVLA